ncbi:MAG: PadR family transcriptional regulator [Clostridia bacterium]|nr:PadR family transcriptional regulator [Clostridia bacterium]MBQ3573349.1 PadR family transcriptional regulator [Clostridia bacterium]MBR3865540.1 PadR family transcriptional regulator [Clostridia bacterium]
MDIQMKRGLLDICVLAAIKDGESYGYQIIKDISPYVAVSESTLYPILRRLEGSGLLTVRSAEHNGRLRKYYCIAPAGKERLDSFSQEWKEIMAIYNFVTREGKAHE